MRTQTLPRKNLLYGRKLKIIQESNHPLLCGFNLSITDKSFDPRKRYRRSMRIEIRRVAEDDARVTLGVVAKDPFMNAPIGKYPQSPSASDGKVSKGGSHDQGRNLLDVAMRSGHGIGYCRSIRHSDKPEGSDT